MSPWFLRCSAAAGVLSVVCLETGWVVTEVGRQPWTVVGLLLTRDAVTTSGNVWLFFAGTLLVLGAVGVAAIFVLLAMKGRWQAGADGGFDVPYGPDQPLEAALEPQRGPNDPVPGGGRAHEREEEVPSR